MGQSAADEQALSAARRMFMYARRRCRSWLILVLVVESLGAHAMGLSRADYAAHKTQIEADYRSDKVACDRLSGNDKDRCVDKARGKEKVARAELDFNNSGSDSDAVKLAIATADLDYAVARERCDDKKSSDDRALCGRQAKAAHVKAREEAKISRKVSDESMFVPRPWG